MWPSIICYVATWNDEIILPHFLRHYAFCDRIVAYDNLSTDRTPELLRAEPRVQIVPRDTGGYFDDALLTQLFETCWHGAECDYVITCGSDEFVIPDPEILREHRGEQIAFQLTGWNMVGKGEPIESMHLAVRDPLFDKTSVFNPRIARMGFEHGLHVAHPSCRVLRAMELRHYNMLSEDYMVRRWHRAATRLTETNIRRGWGRHYRWSERTIRGIHRKAMRRAVQIPSLEEIAVRLKLDG